MDVNVAAGHWTLSSSTSRSGLRSRSCVAAISGTIREAESSRKTANTDFLILILQIKLRDTKPRRAGYRATVYSRAELPGIASGYVTHMIKTRSSISEPLVRFALPQFRAPCMPHLSHDFGFSARQSKNLLFPADMWQEVNEA